MDFALTEEQTAIQDMARGFTADAIAPNARTWETDGTIPREFIAEAGALGLCSIFVPENHGGSGLSRFDGTLIFEELAKGCPTISAFLSIHNMCGWMVSSFGADAMRDKYLPGLSAMAPACNSVCPTPAGNTVAPIVAAALSNIMPAGVK